MCDCLNKHFNKTNYHQIRRQEKRDTHTRQGDKEEQKMEGGRERKREREGGGGERKEVERIHVQLLQCVTRRELIHMRVCVYKPLVSIVAGTIKQLYYQ